MKKLAYRIASSVPPFSWILPKILKLERRVEALERAVEAMKASTEFTRHAAELREVLAHLQVKKAVRFDKVRVGAAHDGGYVMLNDFERISHAYSLGIADNVEWDLQVADRDVPVEQFDYSIERSPVDHPKFHFHCTKVSSLADILATKEPRQLLKIDIEGSEWGFFADAPPGSLELFTQIVGEFHGFHYYFDPAWRRQALRAFEKLNATHQLIHLHPNNGGGWFSAGGQCVPILWEFTFALRSAYRFEDTDETFPGPLDTPNLPDIDDLPIEPLLKSGLCAPR